MTEENQENDQSIDEAAELPHDQAVADAEAQAAELMGEEADTTAEAARPSTMPSGDKTEAKTTPKAADSTLTERIQSYMTTVEDNLADKESLMMAKVFQGIHKSYYDDWRNDSSLLAKLYVTLKRRAAEAKAREKKATD